MCSEPQGFSISACDVIRQIGEGVPLRVFRAADGDERKLLMRARAGDFDVDEYHKKLLE